ncbi:MAG: thiolase family protein [Clostridia bacterium]|nr:thiolase family protein [Clostridia bacterium]
MFKDSVIVSMARTAVGGFGGSLKSLSAVDLGVVSVKEALKRAGLTGDEVDEVVYGCVGQYGLNAFISRLVSLKSGIRESASAQTVNRMCASGLQAIVTASQLIENGDADVVVAGGAESMSNYPYTLQDARWGMRMGMGSTALLDSLQTALCEPTTGEKQHIGITAENIAAKYGLTREELDAYALESQERAAKAIAEGKFKDEIVPVEIKSRKETIVFDTDEHPRATTMEKLGKLRPFVKADGVVTAGNASGVNDAGAALVIMSRQKAEELGLKPIARVVDFATAGVDPQYMGMGPVASTEKLLKKTGMKLEDIGVAELNEAFASQALACIREIGIDPAITNVNGSGISLGHPIGATGAIISIKLISEMKRRGVRYGLASLCIGGGQGMSVIFENLD